MNYLYHLTTGAVFFQTDDTSTSEATLTGMADSGQISQLYRCGEDGFETYFSGSWYPVYTVHQQ